MSTLALQVAGVRIDLRAPGALPEGFGRYRPFAGATGPARWTLELAGAFDGAGPPPGRSLHLRDGRWRVVGLGADLDDVAWLDREGGVGAAPADQGCLLLDTVLRAAVCASLLAEGGLMVHAAAVVVDGAAHLLAGRSGSGKSTLAGLAGHPLSDEISILRPGPEGFVAHATPWWLTRGGSAPLAGVHELAWGGESVTALEGTALRLLSSNLVLPFDAPDDWARGLAVAAAVAGAAPFAQLAFRPDSDVDRLLRSAAAGTR